MRERSPAAGARDGAILALLYSCGLRRAELVGLDVADYSATEGTLAVRHGKRNKQRIVPVVNGTAEALADWLAVRGATPGPLFWSVMGAHRGGRLTTQAIYEMLLSGPARPASTTSARTTSGGRSFQI